MIEVMLESIKVLFPNVLFNMSLFISYFYQNGHNEGFCTPKHIFSVIKVMLESIKVPFPNVLFHLCLFMSYFNQKYIIETFIKMGLYTKLYFLCDWSYVGEDQGSISNVLFHMSLFISYFN